MSVAVLSAPSCGRYTTGLGHPEREARHAAVAAALHALPGVTELTAPDATRAALVRAHDASYVDGLLAREPVEALVPLDADTILGPGTLRAAQAAAGAAVHAVDLVLDGVHPAAFCNVRPPGHHAERARAMGFCFFNNVAVAALHALEARGLERVAVIDFDVHHGNGTEDILGADERVFFCSSFQHPLYPYSGAESNEPGLRNVPLRAGTDGAGWRTAVAPWFPALRAFAPQLLLVSAGFDAHEQDALANLRLHEEDYAWITRELVTLGAELVAPIVSTLEGGYDLQALGASAAAHVGALMGL